MNTQYSHGAGGFVACEVCFKETLLSEAISDEASDHFHYFCGLECFAKWQHRAGRDDFRTLFDIAPVAMVLWRLSDGVCVEANDAFLTLFGYQRAEVIGHTCAELQLWDESDSCTRILGQIQSSRSAQTIVHPYRCKSGRIGRAVYSLNVVDMQGEPHIFGVLSDLSELDRVEANLAESEARFSAIFNTTNAAVAFADNTGTAISFNDAFQKLLGYPAEKLRGMNFAEFTHPDDLAQELPLLSDLQTGKSDHYRIEKRVITASGEVRWIEGLVSAIRDRRGGVSNFVGVLTDITGRRRSEIMLQLFAKVVRHSGEAILISDAENRIVMVNDAFTQLTGYAEHEVLGKNPSILGSGQAPPETFVAMWQSLRATGYWQGELMDRRKDGSCYPKWIAISVLRDINGAVINYIASFTDISERKLAEEKVQQLAYFDPLTNLPNRRLLLDRLDRALAQAQRFNRRMAVMFLDLDNFKSINDTLGHEVGDLLLQEIATRLLDCVRTGDTVSRQGGDEFVIVLSEIGDPRDATAVADKMLKKLAEPVKVAANELEITTSIGISIYTPSDGMSALQLMKDADAAMYEAKRSGRNRSHLSPPTQQS